MRQTLFASIIFFLMVSQVTAQENKPQEQKPTAPSTTSKSEKPKNQVDRMIEDAAKRGETIIGTCVVEDCGKDSAKIPAGVETGRILQMPKPPYPNIARMAHADGEVAVQILIGEDGKVIAAAAISGHPLLFAVSVAAARDAVFSPTLLHGKPVKVTGVIKYNFFAR